jgi:hypothetical protein
MSEEKIVTNKTWNNTPIDVEHKIEIALKFTEE